MRKPNVVLSVTYHDVDYTITMTSAAWEFCEKRGASRTLGSWYRITELFKMIKEHHPHIVYTSLLSQYNECASRFVEL